MFDTGVSWLLLGGLGQAGWSGRDCSGHVERHANMGVVSSMIAVLSPLAMTKYRSGTLHCVRSCICSFVGTPEIDIVPNRVLQSVPNTEAYADGAR